MTEHEQFEKLKQNILGLDISMDDAPFFGFSREEVKAVRFAIDKVLKDTGITIESLIVERDQKGWFR